MKQNIKIYINNDLRELSIKAMEIFLDDKKKTNNHFYIIPGGKTPQLFYEILADQADYWSDSKFILSDERLTNDMSFSNTATFEQVFINKNKNPPELIKYDLKKSKSIIDNKLKSLTPRISMLGLGVDGHTASLFPSTPMIYSNNHDATLLIKNKWEDFNRISLSFNYLMKSEIIIFLLSGEEKSKILYQCINGDLISNLYPAQFIFNNYRNDIHVLCNHSAAKYLIT